VARGPIPYIASFRGSDRGVGTRGCAPGLGSAAGLLTAATDPRAMFRSSAAGGRRDGRIAAIAIGSFSISETSPFRLGRLSSDQ